MSLRRLFNPSVAVGAVLGVSAVIGVQTLLDSRALANQPFMDAALTSLRAARENLVQASPNKGGHRDRAIDLVDRAIEQVKEGIAYAAQ